MHELVAEWQSLIGGEGGGGGGAAAAAAAAAMEENIPQELLRYLKQQNLSSDPPLPAMQQLQSGMDGTLSRSDLGEDEKAKQFLQLQNRHLTFKQQLNTYTHHFQLEIDLQR